MSGYTLANKDLLQLLMQVLGILGVFSWDASLLPNGSHKDTIIFINHLSLHALTWQQPTEIKAAVHIVIAGTCIHSTHAPAYALAHRTAHAHTQTCTHAQAEEYAGIHTRSDTVAT